MIGLASSVFYEMEVTQVFFCRHPLCLCVCLLAGAVGSVAGAREGTG